MEARPVDASAMSDKPAEIPKGTRAWQRRSLELILEQDRIRSTCSGVLAFIDRTIEWKMAQTVVRRVHEVAYLLRGHIDRGDSHVWGRNGLGGTPLRVPGTFIGYVPGIYFGDRDDTLNDERH